MRLNQTPSSRAYLSMPLLLMRWHVHVVLLLLLLCPLSSIPLYLHYSSGCGLVGCSSQQPPAADYIVYIGILPSHPASQPSRSIYRTQRISGQTPHSERATQKKVARVIASV